MREDLAAAAQFAAPSRAPVSPSGPAQRPTGSRYLAAAHRVAAGVIDAANGDSTPASGDHDVFRMVQRTSDSCRVVEPSPAPERPLQIRATPDTTSAVQRKISYRMGTAFQDEAHLRAELKKHFHEQHHADIDELVTAAEAQSGRPIGALDVFNQIHGVIGTQRGWTRAAPPSSSDRHGPQLPRLHPTGQDDPQSAMSAFMTPRVTLARADLVMPDRTASFEGKQDTEEGQHAEVVVLAQVRQYLQGQRIDARQCVLRITINKAPCHLGPKEKNCSQALVNFQGEFQFARFHLYYADRYGEDIKASIENMQGEGIAVTQYEPGAALPAYFEDHVDSELLARIRAKAMIAPVDVQHDPFSADEDDDDGPANHNGGAMEDDELSSSSSASPPPSPRHSKRLRDGSKGNGTPKY